jgi:hypothetical protein
MFVTSGDFVTILNSKDGIIKNFHPSQHVTSVHGSFSGGTLSHASSLIEE